MPRILGAVTLVALGVACIAHADDRLDPWPEPPPQVTADRPFEPPAVERIRHKTRKGWLRALSGKLGDARSALQEHKLVVTSDAAETRTFTYDDVARSVGEAEDKLAEAAVGESATRSVDLTGGEDAVGVLLSRKM
jgi:hypothetical protein